MADDRWIIVPNWDKFQHYSDREPVWIKVYLELRDKPEWEALNYTERGLLVSIWMEFAAARGHLSCSRLGKKTGLTTRSEHLASLNHAGFIQIVASKPLALARSREVREEKKEKGPVAHAPKRKAVDNFEPQRANVLPKDPAQAIRTMIQNGVITDLVDLEAELEGFHLNSNVGDDLRKLLQ
jgi:hypothetical protein